MDAVLVGVGGEVDATRVQQLFALFVGEGGEGNACGGGRGAGYCGGTGSRGGLGEGWANGGVGWRR